VRAFVLLHGFTGAPSAWDGVVRALPPDARVARPWLAGHGPAAHAPARSFEEEVDRIASVVRAEGLRGAHLGGYSLGGRIGSGLLVRHPELFASATLVGAHPGLSSPEERADRVASDERWATSLETRGLEAFADAWEARPLFASQRQLPDATRRAHRARRLSHDPSGLARSLRVLGLGRMPDWSPGLDSVEVPIRLLTGEGDPRFTALAAKLARCLPRATHRTVGGAGHDLVLERPREGAAALLGEEG